LQRQIRICTINDKIAQIRCAPPSPYGNGSATSYGNSEAGRISKIVSATQPGGCCFEPRTEGEVCTNRCRPPPSATRTIQTESQYTKSVQQAAIACGVGPTDPHISAGGGPESIRIQRLRDSIEYVDYTTNPNARFLEYQRFIPPACPPAPIANNLPIPRPRFPCAPNVIGFTLN
jgi:hypothetical protein